MTLREYLDTQDFEFFRLIALYAEGGVIGHFPVAIWRTSKYKDREVLAVDDYAVLIKGGV